MDTFNSFLLGSHFLSPPVLPGMTKLDHIGIAVQNIEQAKYLYRLLGFDLSPAEEIPEEGVRVVRARSGKASSAAGGAGLELLEPLEGNSPIGRFLARRQGALHHVAFQVDNIVEVLDQVKQHGIKVVSGVIRNTPDGHSYFFIHPSGAGGILIEICQAPKAIGDEVS